MNRTTPPRSMLTAMLLTLLHMACGAASPASAGLPTNGQWSTLIASNPENYGTPAYHTGTVDEIGDRYVFTDAFGTWALTLGESPTWTRLSTSQVPGLAPTSAYDPTGRRLLVYGEGMWSMDLTGPSDWRPVNATNSGPGVRAFACSAYDPSRRRFYVYAGLDHGNRLWWLDMSGTTPVWGSAEAVGASPPAGHGCAMILDPVGDRLILYGGYAGGVYAFSLATQVWSRLDTPGPDSPSNRAHALAVFQHDQQRMLLFGGYDSQRRNETYSFDLAPSQAGWRRLEPLGSPPPPTNLLAGGFDSARNRLIVHGGLDAHPGVMALTFPPLDSPPTIASFTPLGGPPGTVVIINGTALQHSAQVFFYDRPALVTIASYSLISTVVPDDAGTGPITVQTPYGEAVSTSDFVVAPPPVPSAAWPDSGRPGQEFELRGQHLGHVTSIRLPNGHEASFSVLSDTTLLISIDGPPATGSITVTRVPLAPVTTAFEFRVLDRRAAPEIVSVRDVPNDQGGAVVVKWLGSEKEHDAGGFVTRYRVWRRAPLDTKVGAARVDVRERAQFSGAYWELVGEIPIGHLGGYAFTASTFQDSIADSPGYVAFFVQALEPGVTPFYSSAVDSGYSVDNLAPPIPLPFVAQYTQGAVSLRWRASSAADFREFHLFRGQAPDFVPNAQNRIATTRDTAFVDRPGGTFLYKLIAVDVHGNRSPIASVSPQFPVAALATAREATAVERSVRLVWSTAAPGGHPISIQRRGGPSDWTTVADTYTNGSGEVVWTDVSVDYGQSYSYRLRWSEGGELIVAGEVSVSLEHPRLALGGMVSNPARSSDGLRALLSLSGLEEAVIEVYDLSGRRLVRHRIPSPLAGMQEVQVPGTRGLSPGVYLVRFRQSRESLAVRALVID